MRVKILTRIPRVTAWNQLGDDPRLQRRDGLRHRPWQEQGTAIVELCLVIMAFFVLTLGLLDVGRAVFVYSSICSAAREATRYAIVHGERAATPATSTDIQDYVVEKLVGMSGVSVTTTWTPDNSQASAVNVTIQYNFQPVTVMFPSVPLSATSEMEISY